MGRNAFHLLPKHDKKLQLLGRRLAFARMRRRHSITLMAERIGVSRPTYYRIEEGDPAVSIGHYAKVLEALQLLKDLDMIAVDFAEPIRAGYFKPSRVHKRLALLGDRIKRVRKRHKKTIEVMAERVGVSRLTYSKIEAGAPTIAIGHLVRTLGVLAILHDLDLLAKDDALGRDLQDAELLC